MSHREQQFFLSNS